MEKIVYTSIGDHEVKLSLSSEAFMNFFERNFPINCEESNVIDIELVIEDGYGVPFVNYDVAIFNQQNIITFQRADYLIKSNTDYSSATIYVHNEFALKHALSNLYSSYIVYHNWGLLIHSSCAVNNDYAHIFSGRSGAGKSTAAKLSSPRKLLSDEATLVKISPEGIIVYNSPFRSELEATGSEKPFPLKSIQLLKQAMTNERILHKKSEAILELMDKVFYWVHSPEETKKILYLLKELVNQTPVYELQFQKNNTFWELIS